MKRRNRFVPKMENAVKDVFFPVTIGIVPSKNEIIEYERRMEFEIRKNMEAFINPK